MRFESPQILWFLPVVLLALGLFFWWAERTRKKLLARFVELYVLRGHRCTGRDSIDAMHVGTLVANLHRNTCGAQPIEYWLLANVAARHIVTHLGQHKCDSAHARPAHANDMKALGLAEIDWRCRRHRCSAMSSMTLARRPLR